MVMVVFSYLRRDVGPQDRRCSLLRASDSQISGLGSVPSESGEDRNIKYLITSRLHNIIVSCLTRSVFVLSVQKIKSAYNLM